MTEGVRVGGEKGAEDQHVRLLMGLVESPMTEEETLLLDRD